MDVLIKNVNAEAWKKFKVGAIENDMKLGEYFDEVVEEIKTKKDGNWEIIKKSKGSLVDLTDKEMNEMRKHMKEVRKNFKFRY